MEALLSYELRDFLMFAPSTYWHMLAQIGSDYWPLQIVLTGAIALGCGYYAWRKSLRPIYSVLSVCWAFVGAIFFLQYFSQIMLAAPYHSALFFAGATMFSVLAFRQSSSQKIDNVGVPLLFYSLCIHPFSGVLLGRDIAAYDVVGLTPDATALVSISILVIVRAPLWAFIIPVLWCVIAGLTMSAMEAPDYWIFVLFISIAMLLRMRGEIRPDNTR
jgi:hypothetical protein